MEWNRIGEAKGYGKYQWEMERMELIITKQVKDPSLFRASQSGTRSQVMMLDLIQGTSGILKLTGLERNETRSHWCMEYGGSTKMVVDEEWVKVKDPSQIRQPNAT